MHDWSLGLDISCFELQVHVKMSVPTDLSTRRSLVFLHAHCAVHKAGISSALARNLFAKSSFIHTTPAT